MVPPFPVLHILKKNVFILKFDSGATVPLRKNYLLSKLKQTKGEENYKMISLGFLTLWGSFFLLFYR